MKNILLALIFTGLCFVSCEKRETLMDGNDQISVETITYQNKEYPKAILFELMSKSTGEEIDRLDYDPVKEVFLIKGHAIELVPSKYIQFELLSKN